MTGVALEVSEREATSLYNRAKHIANTGLVPKPLQGKPDDTFLVLLTGAELGFHPTQALGHLYPINGRITMSAQAMAALAQRRGHEIWVEETSSERCIAAGHRAGQPDRVQRVTWTIDDAKRAGLAGKEVWKSYPAAMLRARAISNLCRMAFPDAVLGLDAVDLLTPEEVGVDEYPDVDAPADDAQDDDIAEAELVDDDPDADEQPQPQPAEEKAASPKWHGDIHRRAKELGISDEQLDAAIFEQTRRTNQGTSVKDLTPPQGGKLMIRLNDIAEKRVDPDELVAAMHAWQADHPPQQQLAAS